MTFEIKDINHFEIRMNNGELTALQTSVDTLKSVLEILEDIGTLLVVKLPDINTEHDISILGERREKR